MVEYNFAAMLSPFTSNSCFPNTVLEQYKIYRAWEKNGCVFIKRGSETELRGEWMNVVRTPSLSLEMLRLPFETRWSPWTWKTPVVEEFDEQEEYSLVEPSAFANHNFPTYSYLYPNFLNRLPILPRGRFSVVNDP